MWCIDDLKEMLNSTIFIYRTAIQLEVSDEMTWNFKNNLKIFKFQWCQTKNFLHIKQASI